MTTANDAARSLADARDRTLACFRANPIALDRPYALGKWTGRQMLFHIVDTETAFLDRLKRLLADEKPLLWALDPNRWHARLTPASRSLTTAAALFAASRAAYEELVTTIATAEWDHTGVHSEAGKLSVRDAVAKCISHNLHHLGQVEAALAGREWKPGV